MSLSLYVSNSVMVFSSNFWTIGLHSGRGPKCLISMVVSEVWQFFLFHLQEDTTMVNLAVALANEGISAFRFDFAGNGYVVLWQDVNMWLLKLLSFSFCVPLFTWSVFGHRPLYYAEFAAWNCLFDNVAYREFIIVNTLTVMVYVENQRGCKWRNY